MSGGRHGIHVDLRMVDLEADVARIVRAEACLAPDELARARRGVPAVHRRRVLLRAALREALADELGTDPASVPLTTTPAGRPCLSTLPGGVLVDASCSASGTLGVVAVGRGGRIGVDLERVAPWSSAVLDEGWLSRSEQVALTALPPEIRLVAVTRAWTQKEAVLKGRGTGLLEDPAAAVTVIDRPAGTVAGWEISDVPVPEGWVASLAVRPPHDEELPS